MRVSSSTSARTPPKSRHTVAAESWRGSQHPVLDLSCEACCATSESLDVDMCEAAS